MQITLLLNGEGAPFDPAAIDAAFAAWKKDDTWDATQSMQADALTKAYAAHQAAAGKPVARLEFCTDIAGDTLHMNHCGVLAARRENVQLDRTLSDAKAALAASTHPALDSVVTAFHVFEKAEGLRLYQSYIDGTIRNAMALSQESYVRAHFGARVTAVLTQRHLDPASEAAFAAAERAWITYRDAWTDLVRAISSARKPPVGVPADDARAIQAAITQDRVDELKHDPGAGP